MIGRLLEVFANEPCVRLKSFPPWTTHATLEIQWLQGGVPVAKGPGLAMETDYFTVVIPAGHFHGTVRLGT